MSPMHDTGTLGHETRLRYTGDSVRVTGNVVF
jgi:hypothetical protein